VSDKLLLEGAVAGHMNHIYDNGEMTFGELKQLLQAAVDGKLRGTEKTDGQNVYLSFDVSTQKARAIRNKTHIKAGGLTVEEFDDFFSAHPNQALRYSFVEALQAFEDVMVELDKDTQLKIFGRKEDNIYFNAEVMNPGNPNAEEGDPSGLGTTNVIPYDKKTLLIHEVGHGMFDPKTALPLDDKGSKERLSLAYTELENAIMDKSTEDPSVFSLETHPRRKLNPAGMSKASEVLSSTIDKINNVVSDFGLNDSNTIQDLVMVQLKPIIDNFGMTEDRNQDFILRLMKLCRSSKDPRKLVPCGTKDPKTGQKLHEPPINIRNLTAGIPPELANDIRHFDKNFSYQDYTAALSNSLYEFTNVILQDFESSFISNNEKAIKDLQNQVSQSIERIKNSSNEMAKKDLEKQLAKLQNVQNINTPSEGFVFNFNGVTYKFTGAFAPSNQILGTERYGRFGPIEPQDGLESPLDSKTGPLTIALFPGSFKPPHKGHFLAAEALAENADIIYIFVSAPQLSGRAMKSGKSISAEQAVQCWNAMIDKSPLKNKARVMVGPQGVASSMMTAINFIQHPADPNNIYAAPDGATVILGVGEKGDDASRYGGKVMAKSKEKRPDLTIKTMAVGPFAHSEQYVSLLNENPAILQSLNKGKGRSIIDAKLFHASDMRDLLDLATEDPIGIELLKDFVVRPEDVFAVMGILGLNPVDKKTSEEDQVEEPEIDGSDLEEIIREAVKSFRKQTAPKAKPSKGKFQRRMRKRLSKAHKTYLDMGRRDLTKHGGAFRKDRPKDISNAFLAEDIEDVDETITVSGGAIEGAPAVKRVFKREEKELKEQEQTLRKTIKIGIREFFENKKKERQDLIEYVIQEHELRLSLREMILEQSSEGPNVDGSDSTGINTLKDLLKNTNVLSTLREVYKTLTTDESQKQSFRAHIVKWVQDTLAPVKLNDVKPKENVAEQVGVDIEGVNDEVLPGDEGKFIDAQDGSEKEKPPEPDPEEEKMKPISGADTTGRNKAERVYPTIEKSIIDYYGELDNPEDQEMFYDYLIANLKLYFDKWDNEMSPTPPEEPTNDEYEQAKSPEEDPGLSAS
tara:strand:- start:2545 stop:5790 length:3246 start_codon:yes stop_codon:yes gene_type:complete